MIAGQLSFAINDSYVKLSVLDLNSNISTFNVIFIRGVVTSLLILLYIILVEKKMPLVPSSQIHVFSL